jgi:hypothetical protein
MFLLIKNPKFNVASFNFSQFFKDDIKGSAFIYLFVLLFLQYFYLILVLFPPSHFSSPYYEAHF